MKKMQHQGLKSMTGFAAEVGSFEAFTWVAEARAVNGRGLDLRLRLPEWIEGLEPETRKMFQARLGRGNVTVSVKLQRDTEVQGLAVNADVLEATLKTLAEVENAAKTAGLSLAPTTAADVAGMRGVLESSEPTAVEDVAPLRAALLESLAKVLDAFEADRAREGAEMSAVLTGQIGKVAVLAKAAGAAVGDREAAVKASMTRAVQRLLDTTDVPDEARLTQELAVISVKNDVTEELDRLASHIAAARALMTEEGPVGRKFDFLMQEFNREANTLCSKSQSTALTAVGLDLKAVIDQMREQVQNIE